MLEYWIDGMLGHWEVKKYSALLLFPPLFQLFHCSIIPGTPPGFWILTAVFLIIILCFAPCALDLAPPSEVT